MWENNTLNPTLKSGFTIFSVFVLLSLDVFYYIVDTIEIQFIDLPIPKNLISLHKPFVVELPARVRDLPGRTLPDGSGATPAHHLRVGVSWFNTCQQYK